MTMTAAISCAWRSRPIRCLFTWPSSANASRHSPRTVDGLEDQRFGGQAARRDHGQQAGALPLRPARTLAIEGTRHRDPCVISNHDTFKAFVEWHGIPFHHVPVNPDNKQAAYAEICRIYDEVKGDTMVLARYMQILPADAVRPLPGQMINIHHSFLPSFVGARPYHQAYQRGVKLIGATCHYVTRDLDQGPIIEQDVIRIDHSDSSKTWCATARTSRRPSWRAACAITSKIACWCTPTRP
jgi:folate-dependent phosphoribosylglycinamide formyltransferase PurN